MTAQGTRLLWREERFERKERGKRVEAHPRDKAMEADPLCPNPDYPLRELRKGEERVLPLHF